VATTALGVGDPFDALLNQVAAILSRDAPGSGDKYGQNSPVFATIASGVKCRYATLSQVPTDEEFLAKSKEAIAFRKVYLRPWFADASPDGSYQPNHVYESTTYNTEPLTHDNWLQINGENYDIFELRNPGGLYHHFECLCRVIEP